MLSLSVASYHLCVISTMASVVDEQAMSSNCLLPNYQWHHKKISSTYFIIIDSKTFAAIGVIYYIGIMSVLCQLAWFLVNELCEVIST